MIYVMVLHCGVLILILQFVGRVIDDDVVAHCVLVVVAFVYRRFGIFYIFF